MRPAIPRKNADDGKTRPGTTAKDFFEKSGYVLLAENDGHIFCSNNVRFHSTPMSPLHHLELSNEMNSDHLDLDYVSSSDESNLESTSSDGSN